MKLITIALLSIIGALLIIAGCGSERPASSLPITIPQSVAEVPEQVEESPGEGTTIEMTDEGFSPDTLTVAAGTTVTFVNKDLNERQHWPASAPHPAHDAYPGSSINKCAAAKQGGVQIFDSCRGLRMGENFSFTFNEKGEWKYHDHLRPSSTGMIVVE